MKMDQTKCIAEELNRGCYSANLSTSSTSRMLLIMLLTLAEDEDEEESRSLAAEELEH